MDTTDETKDVDEGEARFERTLGLIEHYARIGRILEVHTGGHVREDSLAAIVDGVHGRHEEKRERIRELEDELAKTQQALAGERDRADVAEARLRSLYEGLEDLRADAGVPTGAELLIVEDDGTADEARDDEPVEDDGTADAAGDDKPDETAEPTFSDIARDAARRRAAGELEPDTTGAVLADEDGTFTIKGVRYKVYDGDRPLQGTSGKARPVCVCDLGLAYRSVTDGVRRLFGTDRLKSRAGHVTSSLVTGRPCLGHVWRPLVPVDEQ